MVPEAVEHLSISLGRPRRLERRVAWLEGRVWMKLLRWAPEWKRRCSPQGLESDWIPYPDEGGALRGGDAQTRNEERTEEEKKRNLSRRGPRSTVDLTQLRQEWMSWWVREVQV